MIRGFRCLDTKAIFEARGSRKFRNIEAAAKRRLDVLHAAVSLNGLAALRSNHLEALEGDRKGQHSIRINLQWRICFVWQEGHAWDVEIVDYH
ncbi:MAG: type II toxin-antitoxin system RelE/ParE family toxin [Bryobacteraceae bacterium]